MFECKKILSRLLFPLPLSLELLILGLVLLWATRRQKAGKVVVSLAAGLLLILSHSSVADVLLGSLESSYPALHDPAALATRDGSAPLKWVVVLGGGYTDDERLPLTARPSEPSLTRLVEGIRIHQNLPGSKLALSVMDAAGARGMAELARTLGVDPRALVVEEGARDTEEEAEHFQRLVGHDGLVLVTSASHMRRALALFQGRGLSPVPAPTDYRVKRKVWDKPEAFLPSDEDLGKSTRAVYEYLGLAWAKVRSKI